MLSARTLLSAPLLVALVSFSRAADFTADFNKTVNPGTTGWTYGLETSLGGALSVFDANINDPNLYNLWYSSINHTSDFLPTVFLNQTSGTINGDLPGQAGLHPGPTAFAVTRYTMPAAGAATVAGRFYAGDLGTLNEYVLVDGVAKFTALSASADSPFSFTFAATAGDTVDFVVGADAHGVNQDTTPLSATITQAVPEPSALAALGLGAVAVLRRRRK